MQRVILRVLPASSPIREAFFVQKWKPSRELSFCQDRLRLPNR
jgi:hypothetical protein